MRQGGLKIAAQLPGEAVSNVRVNNRFAFAEFRSPEETSKALTMLAGCDLAGRQLSFARPSKYHQQVQLLQQQGLPIP